MVGLWEGYVVSCVWIWVSMKREGISIWGIKRGKKMKGILSTVVVVVVVGEMLFYSNNSWISYCMKSKQVPCLLACLPAWWMWRDMIWYWMKCRQIKNQKGKKRGGSSQQEEQSRKGKGKKKKRFLYDVFFIMSLSLSLSLFLIRTKTRKEKESLCLYILISRNQLPCHRHMEGKCAKAKDYLFAWVYILSYWVGR